MSGLFGGGGGGVSIPTKKAENISRTAEPLEQVSEVGRDRRRKRRRQASSLTAGFGEPQLGVSGLTGVVQ
ncbi:hypothetical protein LCGC14_1093050 [marine sediment metagenome]|uniref:Uncharacterized protein n=1 Tax=marine sediment metagenome TaxID=412755 RepID=A0A0F9MZL9_9ZZZZ